MGDFFQNGEITTIHRFDTTTIEKIEHGIEQYAYSRPCCTCFADDAR